MAMRHHYRFWLGVTVGLAGMLLTLAAQAPAIPRVADGKPDFSGVGQSGGVSLYGEQGTSSPPTGPRGAPAPPRAPLSYQPWAAEKQKSLSAVDDPTLRCLLPGVPRITGMPM